MAEIPGQPAGGGRRPAGSPADGVASRLAAWEVLRRVHAGGAWASPAVDRVLAGGPLDARDRAFAANLAFQTLRWEGTLDWALQQVARRPLTHIEPGLVDVLRLGAWQLLYGHVPDRAAVSTAVEVARQALPGRTVGFANAILRALARERELLAWPSRRTEEGLALRLGYPRWIVRAARARFGARVTDELEAGNAPAGLTLRAVADPARVLDALPPPAQTTAGLYAPEALHVSGAVARDLQVVSEGLATVQDEASMLVARALAAGVARPARILDACAAPGGKATHLAQLGHEVIACDKKPARLRLVRALAQRLDLPVTLCVVDATRRSWRAGAFPGVLVDAPCTGLGVVRRRPELRWRRSASDVSPLAALQRAMLAASAPAVAPGGLLLYTVCTWTVGETVEVAQWFVDHHTEFRPEPVAGLPPSAAAGPGVQLSPGQHGTDGMYLAGFRRPG